MKPFGCCGLASRMIGLNATLRELVGEVLLAQEVEQRRVAVDRRLVEVAADRNPAAIRDLADVVENLVERALAAAERPHPVVRVTVAVERDLDAERTVGRQAIDDFRREQQAVGDDVHHHADAADFAGLRQALGQVVDHRQVQERLTAEERQREALGRDRAHPSFDPLGDARGRLHRHLRGGLVVLAVVALDAVVAREVALQRGQHRDAQLILAGAEFGEEVLDVPAVRLAALDDESVLGERGEGLAFAHVRRESVATEAVEQVRHLARHDELGVREGVHQEHLVSIGERNTNVENRGLHAAPGFRLESQNFPFGDHRLNAGGFPARLSGESCATDIPVLLGDVQRVISRYAGRRQTAETLRWWCDSFDDSRQPA